MKKSVLVPGLWSASAFALPGTGPVDLNINQRMGFVQLRTK
jgi:hypothetical protein